MAVTIDTSSQGSVDGAAAGTLTFTTTTNANRIIFGHVATVPGGSAGTVTYGGVNLALLGTVQSGATGSDRRCELWYVIAPPTGANSGTFSFSNNTQPYVYAFSTYYNVNQATPFINAGSQGGSTSSVSGTINSATGDMIIDFLSARGAAPTASQTQIYEGSAPAPGTNVLGASQRMSGQAIGTMTWTLPAANTFGYFSLDLQQFIATTSNPGYKTLLGVGQI